MINSWLISTFLFWVFTSLFLGNPFHAVYLSHTEIEVTDGVIDIQVKVFSDDLQNALKNHDLSAYKPAGLEQFFSQNEDLAKLYFEEYFQLWSEETPLTLQLESFTIEGDAHFIRFSSTLPKTSHSLTLKANFFVELFPTQINVVKVKNGTQVQFLRFNKPIAPQTLNFQN